MRPALACGALAALAVFVLAGGATARPDHRPLLKLEVKGSGQVVTFDGRLRCSNRCQGRYGLGRTLKLSALPNEGFLFDRWERACIGKAPICDLAIDRNTSAQGRFVGEPTPVWISVGGPGRIVSDKGGLNCGDGIYLCTAELPNAAKVKLTPVPSAGGRFGAWDGPCTQAGSGPCVLQVESLRTEVAAAFGHTAPEPGPQTLTVHGAATSEPPGIDCFSGRCSASFPSGTLVTLRKDYGVWQPACTGQGLERCLLMIDAPTDVTIGPPPPPDPPPPPRPRGELQVTVSGGGLVLGADSGIVCGWSPRTRNECSYDFETYFTQTRHLQAVATRRVRFVRWGGLCHGKSRTCTIQMTNHPRKDLSTFVVTALFRRR